MRAEGFSRVALLAATTAHAGQNALAGLKSRPAPCTPPFPLNASVSPARSLPPPLLPFLAPPSASTMRLFTTLAYAPAASASRECAAATRGTAMRGAHGAAKRVSPPPPSMDLTPPPPPLSFPPAGPESPPEKHTLSPLMHKLATTLRFSKSAATAAAAPPTPDAAWSIPAVAGVQRHGSVCTDADHQAGCMDMAAYPASPRPALAPTATASTPADLEAACADTLAAFALCLSLDMELSPDEARWLVQSPEPELDDAALAALDADPPAPTHAPAAAEARPAPCPAAEACHTPSPARRSPGALLAALRRCATAAHGKLTSCLARPATLEPECAWWVCTDGDFELSVNWS